MIYVAIAACASTAVVSVVLGGLLRSIIRQGARERERLVNQVCHLSGRTWTPPPSWEPPPDDEPAEKLLYLAPEQYVS